MRIVIVPDTQVKPGVPTEHILAAGNYAVSQRPDIILIGGDWWDMPSLSMFNSAKDVEGSRVAADIQSGKDAMELFLSPLKRLQERQKANKKAVYKPRLIFITGNHDPMVRVKRLVDQQPILEGYAPDDCKGWLEDLGFEVHDFLNIVEVEGIRFSHYFQNMHSAKKGPLSGNIVTMMKNAGFSFVMFHQQGKKCHSFRLGDGTNRLGIVVGSFYQHEESYEGPQGGNNWNGIIVLNEVKDGGADIVEVSMQYLLNNWL